MLLEPQQLFVEFNKNPPASSEAIQAFKAASWVQLPEDYLEFLRECNGGEGFIGGAYAMLWRVEELLEMNEGYSVREFAPELFLFGSDGGGEAYAYNLQTGMMPIVMVPFIPLEAELGIPLGANFHEFLETLYRTE
jgi:hypothetical protein